MKSFFLPNFLFESESGGERSGIPADASRQASLAWKFGPSIELTPLFPLIGNKDPNHKEMMPRRRLSYQLINLSEPFLCSSSESLSVFAAAVRTGSKFRTGGRRSSFTFLLTGLSRRLIWDIVSSPSCKHPSRGSHFSDFDVIF